MNSFLSQLEELNIRILPFNDTMIGSTGYIDRIKCEDMTYPIMKGEDHHGRSFVSIKFMCTSSEENNGETEDVVENKNIKKQFEAVGTFFQRYADCVHNVAYGTCYNLHESFFDDSRVRNQEEINSCTDRIKKCYNGETIFTLTSPWNKNTTKITIPYFRDQIELQLLVYLYKDVVGCIMNYL